METIANSGEEDFRQNNSANQIKKGEHDFCLTDDLWKDLSEKEISEKGFKAFANGIDEDFLMAALIAESLNEDKLVITSENVSTNIVVRFFSRKFHRLKKSASSIWDNSLGIRKNLLNHWKNFLDKLDFQGFISSPAKTVWKHLFDFIFVIIVLTLIVGFGVWSYRMIGLIQNPKGVVQTKAELSAYQKIAAKDLEGNNTKDFVGRYTSKKVGLNEVLTENYLLSNEISRQMNDRVVFSIPVKTETLSSNIEPNKKISLLFSSKLPYTKDFPRSILAKDIILLKVEKKSGLSILVVALKQDQLIKVKDILGAAEVFVLEK